LVASGIWRSHASQLCAVSGRRFVRLSSRCRCSATFELAPGPVAHGNAEPFQRSRWWDDDAALPAFFQDQLGQMAKSIVLDRLRQQPLR